MRNMRILIYFAVTRYDDRIYMTEQEKEKSQSRFVDIVDDIYDLKNELDWSELDETHQPKEVGCYQAVIEYRQTAEDDYSLVVISCTPVCVI